MMIRPGTLLAMTVAGRLEENGVLRCEVRAGEWSLAGTRWLRRNVLHGAGPFGLCRSNPSALSWLPPSRAISSRTAAFIVAIDMIALTYSDLGIFP